MPYIANGDVQLYFEVCGEGPPLLLISGLGGGTWSWYGQVPFFGEHYRTITLDNRGAGKSSTPPGPYHMTEFAKDTLKVLDALRVDQTFVLALSMGGMIAQELALMAPQRVTAMVLGCTHCGGGTRIPPSPEVLEILLSNSGLNQEQIVEKNLPLFFSETFLKSRPDVIEEYRAAQVASPEQPDYAFRAQLAAIATFDRCKELSRIRIPTLIIAGSRDMLVPMENARRLNNHIRKSRMVEIPGAGHALHAECRDKLNAMAHDFFENIGSQMSLDELQDFGG